MKSNTSKRKVNTQGGIATRRKVAPKQSNNAARKKSTTNDGRESQQETNAAAKKTDHRELEKIRNNVEKQKRAFIIENAGEASTDDEDDFPSIANRRKLMINSHVNTVRGNQRKVNMVL